MNIQFRLHFVILIFPAAVLQATPSGVPESINYQGRISVANVNFNGPGLFKFALVDGGANQNQPATAYATVTGGEVGEIFRITMGSGYTEAPVVTITGDGTGATAVASLGGGSGSGTGPTDSVGTITIMDHGSGYTFATISIAPPTPNMVFASFWSNDGTSLAGSEPVSAVPINVVNGLYSLAIGDTSLANMTAELPGVVFDNQDVRLRVWFDDGMHGSQLLTPDQRFATVPYSFRASFAQTVPAGAITSEHLANGAVSGSKLAAGAVTADRLNVTGAPNSGQVLGFDGANLTWINAAGGGAGGGSLALPFSGLAASTGSLFSVNNSHPSGPDAWAIYGHSQNSIGVFGQTHGDSSGVLGRAEGVSGQAMFGYASNSATGVLGFSEGGDGLIGVSKIGNHNGVVGRNDEPTAGPGGINFSGGSGVYGYASQDAVGVQGISEKGDGIFGRTNRANKNAIYGYTDQVNSVGVKGDSANGDGLVGHTDAANKSGVFAYASRSDNYAAFFSNTGGGKAIATNGKVDVGAILPSTASPLFASSLSTTAQTSPSPSPLEEVRIFQRAQSSSSMVTVPANLTKAVRPTTLVSLAL